MAGKQHERELARARAARARQREEDRQKKRTRVALGVVGGVLAVSLVAGIALAATGGDNEPTSSATPTQTPTQASALAATEPVVDSCEATSGDGPADLQFDDYGKVKKGDDRAATLVLDTNCGTITVELNSEDAPETASALAFLAGEKYFDGTVCHRLVTEGIHVLQCGDPKATGNGDPGFTVPDENLPEAGPDGTAVYERGTVAMANAGPGTVGSQFFLVSKDSPLPPSYTVVGTLTDESLDVLDAVADAGTADGSADGQPRQALEIIKASTTTKAEQ